MTPSSYSKPRRGSPATARGSAAAGRPRRAVAEIRVQRRGRRAPGTRGSWNWPNVELEVAALGDRERVRERLGQSREDLAHLLGRLEVELVGRRTCHRFGSDDLGAGRMQSSTSWARGVRRLDVVGVVRAAERQAEALGRCGAALGDLDLLGEAVVLDLEEVVVLARRSRRTSRRPRGPSRSSPARSSRVTSPLRQPGEDDQPVRVLGQHLLVDARLVVVALEVAPGDELDQVAVARLVLGTRTVSGCALVPAVLPGALDRGCRARCTAPAEDRLDAGRSRALVELDRAEHVAVVGERERGHAAAWPRARPALRGAPPPSSRLYSRVDVEVDELGRGLATPLSVSWGRAVRMPRIIAQDARGFRPAPRAGPRSARASWRCPSIARSVRCPGRILVTIGSAPCRNGCPTAGTAAASRSA